MRTQHIPTTSSPTSFTPASLILAYTAAKDEWENPDRGYVADATPPREPGTFLVTPTTEADHDRLGKELFRHNIMPPTNDTFRALVINEAFEILGDNDGEALANLLDAYWTAEDVYSTQMSEWYEQDRQRRADEAEGVPSRPPEPLPARTMGVRDRNKATLLFDDLRTQSRKVRDMTVEMQSYEPVQTAGMCRMLLTGWSGFNTPFVLEDGIIPLETYDALRAEIGKQAMNELQMFVLAGGRLTDTERGNSESLLETEQHPTLSSEPIGEQHSDGSSTSAESSTVTDLSNLSSEAIPEGASEPITAESSISTSTSIGETVRSEPSPVT